jgi:sialic acid synthase SpsE
MMIKTIAEIGINHNGDKEKALRLISYASESNCWAVKFQYRTDDFFANNDEMGSTLIREELQRSNLKENWISDLIDYSKELGLKVGFSFFRKKDLVDFFETKEFHADFIKIPSPEFRNLSLIKKAKSFAPIMISYGGGEENEIRRYVELSELTRHDVIFHCISNYPIAIGNQQLEFLKRIKTFSKAQTGYSSHDEEWEVNLFAAQFGINYIERHLCESKLDVGLDISTSSDPSEFKRLNKLLTNYNSILQSTKRTPNQGEVLNVRNLGTSLYAKRDIPIGQKLSIEDFEEKSPRVGISQEEFKLFESQAIKHPIMKGDALIEGNFILVENTIPKELSNFSNQNQLSLPVRLHDFDFFKNRFKFDRYEFHLSYKEIFELEENGFDSVLNIVSEQETYSIHLPDYISKDELINPFSKNLIVKETSERIINTCLQLAMNLEEKTGNKCLVLGSFSMNVFDTKNEFYNTFSEFISNKKNTFGIEIIAQWLPKKAWYFGGTVLVDLFCTYEDVKYCCKYDIPICLDIAHLILSANYFNEDWKNWFSELIPLCRHIHLSDAEGTDGEGVKFGKGDIHSLKEIMEIDSIKVLEIWEGHLNQGEGFEEGLNFLLQETQTN